MNPGYPTARRAAESGDSASSRRGFVRRASALAALAALALVGSAGCDPRQMLYFVQPFEPQIPAPGPDLKGKRVVVITKAVAGALYDHPTLDQELGREVQAVLRSKVKKIDLVDAAKVEEWDRAHPAWTDAGELAEAFEADVVISLELQQFQTQSAESPGLFEGRSSVHIRVVAWDYPKDDKDRPMKERPKESKMIYEADRETVFPTRGPMPASAEVTPSTFKNRFLDVVAAEVSWHFVSHAPGDDIQDVTF